MTGVSTVDRCRSPEFFVDRPNEGVVKVWARRLAARPADFRRLRRRPPKKQIPITYHHHLTLSTHPATEERLDELRREMASLTGSWRPLSVDMAAAKAALPATP